MLLPVIDRALRQRAFALAMGVLGCALAARYLAVGLTAGGTDKYTLLGTVWCIAVGWAAAEARTSRQRCLVAAAIVVGGVGYFGDDLSRTAVLVVGMLVLLAPGTCACPTKSPASSTRSRERRCGST